MTLTTEPPAGNHRRVAWALIAVICTYGAAALLGWPQRATELRNAAHAVAPGADELRHVPAAAAGDAAARHEVGQVPPAYFTVLPFVILLGAIATFPLLPWTEHWWESNLHRFYVAAGLGLATLAYYALLHGHAIEGHFPGAKSVAPAAQGVSWGVAGTIFANAILGEFVPFIVLLFSLYVISGGIRIEGDLAAHPATNATFLAIGAVLANLIGTTGAAMVLIRPLLETNSERRHVQHTVVFFIFVVCNCGGCLLPIGDPPLFLGYLQGVDFLWTLTLWPAWLLVNLGLVACYYALDRWRYYPRESRGDLVVDELRVQKLRFRGLWPNAWLLGAVVLVVALCDPAKTLPGTNWHAWVYLREVLQLALVAFSLLVGSAAVRHDNRFNYAAIVEVAALFLGIFICMQPALQILEVRGSELGIDRPAEFFWATGSLSAVLDNAPTYLVFFKAAQSLPVGDAGAVAGVDPRNLAAISLGAVFMGALTYIGNGPNFMVKAIAEKSGVRMPSFFGYLGYSLAVLLPLFVLVTFLLFR